MNIIFIDDDEDLNYLQKKMCARSDKISNFYIASRALQALGYLSDSSMSPDIIFVDIHMPGMSGLEFVEQFEKKFKVRFPETQIYVLSSSVRELDSKAALDFKSVHGYITKPLTEEKLEEILLKVAQSRLSRVNHLVANSAHKGK